MFTPLFFTGVAVGILIATIIFWLLFITTKRD